MFDIPENKLPNILNDDSRLNVLFSPLRNKSVNSKDWEDKISTWKSIIKVYCETNDIYFFTPSTLNNVFLRHGRSPPCLKEVFDDMIKNNEVEAKEVFIKKSELTWGRWLSDIIIRKPLSWSYNTLKKSVFINTSTEGEYVHLEVIKTKSEIMLSTVPDNIKKRVISIKELLQVLNKDISSVENVKLLLHYLCQQKKIATKISNNGNNELDTLLIKIGDGHTPVIISDIDIGIHMLEQNERLISKNVEDLEDQIANCIKEAKIHLQKKHRQMAKSYLVKKHTLEKQLEKKANALYNIQTCLEQLKGADTNTHVWDAYKNALNAFNSVYKEPDSILDAVDDTMLKLGEALDQHNDIQSALARSPTSEEDTSALEAELEDLLKTDSSSQDQPPDDNSGLSDDLNKQFDKLIIELPNVPENSPDVSVQEAL